MLKISSLKTKSKKLKDFRQHQWELVHPEHFGTKQDNKYWERKRFIFKAEEGKDLVGVLQGDFVAGVMYIEQLIIKSNKRGMGIGSALVEKAEKLAKEMKLHKIYLKTGVGWKSVGFYKALGYKPEAKITRYFEKKDFYILTKDLGV